MAGGKRITDRVIYFVKLAYVVDFDGTVTRKDITSILAKTYAGQAASEVYRLYREGKIGMRRWLEEMVRHFPGDYEQMLALALAAADFKPGFAQFLIFAHESGSPVYIASDGFGFYIEPILERQGLLEYISGIYCNSLVIGSNGSVAIETPHGNPTCDICGNCKAMHVVKLKEKGFRVVYIGNGFNDRYGASHADFIFARAGDRLAEYCAANNIPFVPFADFYDIIQFSYPDKMADVGRPLCTP